MVRYLCLVFRVCSSPDWGCRHWHSVTIVKANVDIIIALQRERRRETSQKYPISIQGEWQWNIFQCQKLELSLGLICQYFDVRVNLLTIHLSQESAKDTYPSAGPLSSNTTDCENTALYKISSTEKNVNGIFSLDMHVSEQCKFVLDSIVPKMLSNLSLSLPFKSLFLLIRSTALVRNICEDVTFAKFSFVSSAKQLVLCAINVQQFCTNKF